MMKKNDVIQRLNAGGRILVDSIYRRAQVCDASGENWETVRYDVAERLQQTPGYKKVKTDWYASWYIEKDWNQESADVEAATLAALAAVIPSQEPENVTETDGQMNVFFDASDALEAQQEPEKALTPYERVTAKNPECENAWRLPGYPGPVYTIQYTDARGGWWSCHYPNAADYLEAVKQITRDGGHIEKTTKTEAGQVEELEELEELQENAEPVYLEESWPESNEKPGIWYSIEWPAGLPTIYHTVSDFRTAVHQARHNGRHIEAAWRHDWRNAGNVGTRRAIIPETSQEKTDRENREHCARIARDVELYAYGNAFKCSHCDAVNHLDDIYQEDRENEYICPDCGEILDRDDLENLTLYDYFADCLDVEYRCGSDRKYRSVCIMIACGGPNIYIDTASKNVELYWWTDRARYPLSYDAVEAVDEWAEEYWNCL